MDYVLSPRLLTFFHFSHRLTVHSCAEIRRWQIMVAINPAQRAESSLHIKIWKEVDWNCRAFRELLIFHQCRNSLPTVKFGSLFSSQLTEALSALSYLFLSITASRNQSAGFVSCVLHLIN